MKVRVRVRTLTVMDLALMSPAGLPRGEVTERSEDQGVKGIKGPSPLWTLGPFQTSLFSCAEPNINEQNPLFEFICIRFGA